MSLPEKWKEAIWHLIFGAEGDFDRDRLVSEITAALIPLWEEQQAQAQRDVEAAEEAASRDFYEPLRLANNMLLSLAVKFLPGEGEDCELYRELSGHLLGLTVSAEQRPGYAGKGALARHDAELRKQVRKEDAELLDAKLREMESSGLDYSWSELIRQALDKPESTVREQP